MSTLIKCDKCGKFIKDSSNRKEKYEISVNGSDIHSTIDVCERCLSSFYLDYLGWIWKDDKSQYVPLI